MLLKHVISLTFFLAFLIVGYKSMVDPTFMFVGMPIIIFGWVSSQIIKEGFLAISWLVTHHLLNDHDDEK